MEPKEDGVVVPHVDRVTQDGVEWFGHVQVAHTATGDAGGTCAGLGLVEQNDVAT